MDKWEYRWESISVRLRHTERVEMGRLNELGAEGWEAVGIIGDPFKNAAVLLKRPVRP